MRIWRCDYLQNMTGKDALDDTPDGRNILMVKQSSDCISLGISCDFTCSESQNSPRQWNEWQTGWRQPKPKSLASKLPSVSVVFSTGSLRRRCPMGGSAKGMPGSRSEVKSNQNYGPFACSPPKKSWFKRVTSRPITVVCPSCTWGAAHARGTREAKRNSNMAVSVWVPLRTCFTGKRR